MVNFLAQRLRSPVDFRIPRMEIEPIDFTTTAIRRNTMMEWNKVGIAAKVINRDTTNACIVRFHSPNGVARRVEPNTAKTFPLWFNEIHVEPDGTTGSGQLEIDLVDEDDAKRR